MKRQSTSTGYVVLALVVALVGCEAAGTAAGTEDIAGSTSPVTGWADAGDDPGSDPQGTNGKDTIGAADEDAAAAEEIPLPDSDFCTENPGSPFCPCESNDDCFSGYCIPSSQGDQLCTKTCEDSCPDGWSCKPDPGGAETSYICVEDQINLCRPCQFNDDCKYFSHVGDRCVFLGEAEGSFCGTACEDENDCREGYGCQEVPDVETGELSNQCVKLDGDCECTSRAIQEAAATTCKNAQCAGTRVCTSEGLSACNAPEPEPESCDGVDNNCNGQVDEGFLDTDGDGLADCVDEDDDNDEVLDEEDNCALVGNAEQGDDDGDQIGNLCDPPPVPVITGTDPPSPADNVEPLVIGTGETGTIIYLFTSPECDAPKAVGVVEDGAWQEFLTVNDGVTTEIYAAAESVPYGVLSACTTEPFLYDEIGDLDDQTPPAIVITGSEPPSPSFSMTPDVLGETEPGATVRLYQDADCTGADLGETVANETGDFAFGIDAIENSDYAVSAQATDKANNLGPCSAVFVYTNDTVVPEPPTFTDTSPDSPSADNTSPILLGNCEGFASVQVYTNADCSGEPHASSTATPSGVFAVPVTAAENAETTYWGTTTDVAGNVSSCSTDSFTYIHDNELPMTPVIVETNPPSPGSVTQPTVIGVTEPNSFVQVYTGPGCTGVAISGEADEDGNFAFAVIVNENTQTLLYASATDGTGLVSDCTPEGFPYVHDGVNPEAPIFTGTEPTSPGTAMTFDVMGSAEAGATLTLHLDQDCATPALVTTMVADTGEFTVNVEAIANSPLNLWGRATDGAGNLSPCTDDAVTYVHDDVPPAAPVLTGTLPPSPAPTTEPLVLGTSDPDVTIALFSNPACVGTTLGEGLATEDGTFEVPAVVTEDGTTYVFAHAVDAAGNVSACSADSLIYEYDDSQPEIPQIESSNPESPANHNEPVLIGIAQAQTTVMIYTNAECSGEPEATVEANAVGDFEVAVLVPDDTTTSFYANALNALGVYSPCSVSPFVYIEDSREPLAPVLTHTTPDPPSNQITPIVHGAVEPGTILRFYKDSECEGDEIGLGAAQVGDFAVPATVNANGDTMLYATASDNVGNTSACSTPGLLFTHDDIAPEPPLLDATTPPSPSDTVTEPIVLGSASPHAMVTIYGNPLCNGPVLGQAAASALGLVSAPVMLNENSVTTLFGTATDEAGNTSVCSQEPLTYIHDNAVPDAPLLLGTSPDSPGTETLPTVHAQSEPGATVRVFLQPGCTGFMSGSGEAGFNGLANFQILVPENAATTLYADAMDIGGQVSECTPQPLLYEHDGIAPEPPLLIDTDPTSPSFVETPELLGETEPFCNVDIWTNESCAGDPAFSVEADEVGDFNTTIAANINATLTLSARATDPAGNVSDCGTPMVYLHDDVPPSVPVLDATSPVSPSSFLEPVVHGTSDPAVRIRVYDNAACDGAMLGEADASAGGLFAVTVTPAINTTTTLHAEAVDEAGNVSGCSGNLLYTHDDTQPTVPVILGATPESPNNQSTEPILYGSAEPNATIRIYTNEACSGAAEAVSTSDVIGVFEVQVQVEPNSQTQYWVASEDSASNISPCSPGAYIYIHDILTPQAPLLEGTTPESPSNTSTSPVVFGTAEVLGTIGLYLTPDCSGEPVVTSFNVSFDGDAFEVPIDVAENSTTSVYATVTDQAGNISPCTVDPLVYIHDTIAPEPPILTGTTPESPSNQPVPLVDGTAEPLSEVTLYGDAECTGNELGKDTATPEGTFGIAAFVGFDAETLLYATARDDAGNISSCSEVPLSYVNDSSPPQTPVLTHTVPESPSTTNTTPTVFGNTEPSITVNLYTIDGCILDPIATTTADEDGDFSFIVTVPDNAITVFYANSVDEIGNISLCSEGLEFLHDDEVPEAPLLMGTDPESPGQDPTPEVLGESEAEILVYLFTTPDCSGDPIGEGVSDEIGTFAVEASTSNDNASITYYAYVVDGAGNTSPCSEGLVYIHDTIAPEPPVLLETLPESPGSHKSPGFVGTAEANALVKLYDEVDCSGQQTGKGDADADGSFTVQANVKANQTTTTHGTATDAAGNVSVCGSGLDYTHDDKAPNKPIILGTDPESPNNQSTNPVVFGTAEPGCTLALLTDLNCFLEPAGTTVTDEEGNWSLTVSVEANTQTPLRAYCTDASDNQSECSSELYYIHDDIPPEFDGIDNVVAVDEDTMVASWLPATDNFTLPFNMVYEVCVTTECGGCDGENFTPTYEMMPGTLQVTVDELLPDTRYYYAVRARDEAGNVDTNDKDIAIKTPGAKMATGIAVGESQTCALLSDGLLACWGDETVPTLDEPPLAIGMGLNHSCAVLRDGQMRCWGANTSGQLGNGNTNNSAVPVAVLQVADAVRVSVGVAHTCAVMSDSRVQCWGQNQHGQLGDGTEELRAKPTNVYMANGVLLTGAVDVACGWNHTCAAMADGTVKCWGLNVLGQLGDGTQVSSPYPIDAMVSGSVRQVVAGEGHTCGLRVDGDVTCWGWNEFGQLGDGTNEINPMPSSVGLYDVRQLGGGAWHVCATLTDGSGQCWGRNESGQLGNGTAINANVPQLVTGLTDTIAIGAGSNHSCGLLSDGSVRCWGANLGGELGNGSTGTSLVPVLVTAISGVSHLTHVSRSSEHGCARVSDGSLRCWGKNSSGQVGDGETTLNGEVTIVETPATVMVATGEFNSCALIDDGSVRCWGANTSGSVGNGQTSAPVKIPAVVSDLVGVIDISVGRLHACALTASGGIYCWGANESGQLGVGDLDDRHMPTEVDMDAAVAIAAGDRHTCAVMATGDVQCWGLNEHGQLGVGDFESTVWPEPVLNLDLVVGIVAGKDHTCALRSNGTIRCWGANGKGQLGDGTTVDKPEQTPVPGLNKVIDVSAGLAHTCVTVVDGTASCWGSNGSAELGDPDAGTFSASPINVLDLLSDVRTIEAGTYSTCALGYDGLVQCWGYNNNLHLGTGELLLVESPMLVDCLP